MGKYRVITKLVINFLKNVKISKFQLDYMCNPFIPRHMTVDCKRLRSFSKFKFQAFIKCIE